MSTVYELNLPFRVSLDYRRLIMLLYALGLVAVWCYAYPFWVSVYVTLALLVHGGYLYWVGQPYKHYATLGFIGKHWVLTDTLGLKTDYSQLRVVYDFGFMCCVALQGRTRPKYLLFFRDQLTLDERRALYFSQLDWREPTLLNSMSESSEG